ncbi:hypothetical protein AYO20_03320 [Fonsecaea nubica]|uniref:SDR family oxidoreductase n=1 Tax=Fonsecaea nubica TaxID=856822 RepID=A0A178D8C8_9EURO|nr:hypothetical protein AYO20_03320 [Fonsecaea nubica]OAL37471.1 hypothetical protein AYO20_03320 [Fonsecaea nubica]
MSGTSLIDLTGKVIVVSGAASGIGRETAIQIAARGAKVSICDVQSSLLDETVDLIAQNGGTVMGTCVDVRERKSVEAWIRRTVETFGKLDGAANIAGVAGADTGVAGIADLDDADWALVFDVNVKGLMHCLRAQVPNMNERGGSIVNMSSLWGSRGWPRQYAYNASKHAINGITRCLAKELGPRNIRVNAVAPGKIETPMSPTTDSEETLAELIPLGRKGTALEVAETVAFLLCDASAYISSAIIGVDGGRLS